MERRPNSRPDTSCSVHLEHETPRNIRPACLERGLANQYVCWMLVWYDRPRYPEFRTYSARQQSFKKMDWAQPIRSAHEFSVAGLFCTGKELRIGVAKEKTVHILHYTFI